MAFTVAGRWFMTLMPDESGNKIEFFFFVNPVGAGQTTFTGALCDETGEKIPVVKLNGAGKHVALRKGRFRQSQVHADHFLMSVEINLGGSTILLSGVASPSATANKLKFDGTYVRIRRADVTDLEALASEPDEADPGDTGTGGGQQPPPA